MSMFHKKSSIAVKEQNEYLTNRNQTLLAKCEKLIAENHQIASRKDESAKELAELKPKMDAIQDDFTKISEEIRKLKERLRSSEENNRVLKNEKNDLEKRMALKDAIIIADRKTMDDLKKQIQQEKTESVKKSGLTTPQNMKVVLETEALKEAIETVKMHFEEKISALTDKVNGINKASNNKQNPLVRPNGLHQKSEKPIHNKELVEGVVVEHSEMPDHCGSAPSPLPDDVHSI